MSKHGDALLTLSKGIQVPTQYLSYFEVSNPTGPRGYALNCIK
jgi:hypothetical protein